MPRSTSACPQLWCVAKVESGYLTIQIFTNIYNYIYIYDWLIAIADSSSLVITSLREPSQSTTKITFPPSTCGAKNPDGGTWTARLKDIQIQAPHSPRCLQDLDVFLDALKPWCLPYVLRDVFLGKTWKGSSFSNFYFKDAYGNPGVQPFRGVARIQNDRRWNLRCRTSSQGEGGGFEPWIETVKSRFESFDFIRWFW